MNCQIDDIHEISLDSVYRHVKHTFLELQESKESFFRAETKHLQQNLTSPVKFI